ncbi:leucine-rich repeat-containing protein 58 [Striga asiatica]|uniref:Leucine-rich repeat-containing protein 58 n=1 Tax=Striga asiatica TaxID=4170 RepID=A0A5A7Q7J5_STRAF|nr:leucine-rich repeat-containing protein 58 [Striga asiatica]
MKPVIAPGNNPRRLLRLDLVQTHRAIGGQHQILPGDLWQLLEIGLRQTLLRAALDRKIVPLGGAACGVTEQTDIDKEDGAHASARRPWLRTMVKMAFGKGGMFGGVNFVGKMGMSWKKWKSVCAIECKCNKEQNGRNFIEIR